MNPFSFGQFSDFFQAPHLMSNAAGFRGGSPTKYAEEFQSAQKNARKIWG